MKKRMCKIIAFAACLALSVFGLVACGKKAPGGDIDTPPSDDKCYAVIERSIMLVETPAAFRLAWSAVYDETGYIVIVNGDTVTTSETRLNLRDNPQINLPADKVFNVTIIATAPNKNNSDPTTKTFTAEGNKKLNNPQIKSLKNGILEWECEGVKNFSLKINGVAVKSAGSDYYTSTSIDTSAYPGAFSVELYAAGDNTYTVDSDKIAFGVNEAHSRMSMLSPEVTCSNGVLSWTGVDGAKGYRVLDINRTVKYVYPESIESESYEYDAASGLFTYDLSERVLVYGVYPDSSDPAVDDAAIVPMDIHYLDGEGTVASPYLIKTAFDLRAIDYYEARYAEKLKTDPATPRNNYKIVNDIEYLPASENESNINKLITPFYGTLDGNGKMLSGIDVNYDAGRWSLFDEIVSGATVKNITFLTPEIVNTVRGPKLPINASIATVAYNNGGTIDGIKVVNANYQAAGGEISGICAHNYGTVKNCEVSGSFRQNKVGLQGEACYEMAGIVLENKNGGVVTANKVTSITMTGTRLSGDDGGSYYNVRTAAGIVSVNRKGGTVSNNSYENVRMTNVLNAESTEYGGLVAYNAGTVTTGTGTLGSFICSATLAPSSKTVGKNDGTAN